MSSNFFFDLPEALRLVICSSWLNLVDLGHLDGAVCIRKYRPGFLAMISSPSFVLSTETVELAHTQADIKWVLSRRLSLSSVTLYGIILKNKHQCQAFFETTGNSIQSLNLRSYLDPDCYETGELDLKPLLPSLYAQIVKYCPRLTEFSVQSSRQINYHPEFTTFLNAFPDLRVLKVDFTDYLDADNVSAIMNMPRLEVLNLQSLEFNTSFTHLAEHQVAASVTTLTCGELVFQREYADHNRIVFPDLRTLTTSVKNSEDLIRMSKLWPLLTVVDIRTFFPISQRNGMTIFQNWKHLTHCTLYNPLLKLMSADAWLNLLQHCPALQYLNTVQGADERVCEMRYLLTQPTVVYPVDYTGSRLCELHVDDLSEADLCNVIALCPYLHTLNIRHVGHSTPGTDASPRAEHTLHHINNTSIRVLHLHNCPHLDDTHLLPLTTITELHLSRIGRNVTNQAILDLSARCPCLRAVYMCSCEGITDAVIEPLCARSPGLKLLFFYNKKRHYIDFN